MTHTHTHTRRRRQSVDCYENTYMYIVKEPTPLETAANNNYNTRVCNVYRRTVDVVFIVCRALAIFIVPQTIRRPFIIIIVVLPTRD